MGSHYAFGNLKELEMKKRTSRQDSCDTHPDYWDCECEKCYIHHKNVDKCTSCGAQAKDQPDSRLEEVERLHRAAPALQKACETALERLEINNCEDSEAKFIKVIKSALRKARPGKLI